jgi:phosphohistidine phosphatase
MKDLLILRHAKSSWSELGKSDFDRTLKPRGLSDARNVGKKYGEVIRKLDVVFSSPANRAIQTAITVCKSADVNLDTIKIVELFYQADFTEIFNFVREIPEEIKNTMIVGHNPTFTYFANLFLKEPIDNLPTSGLVQLTFNVEFWKDIDKENVVFTSLEFPKFAD